MPETKERLPAGMSDPSKRSISNPKLKDTMYFRKYSAETNGEYTEVEMTVGPGGETPIHYHTRYTETFECLSPGLGVLLDGETFTPKEGESITVPVGHVHKWFNHRDRDVRFNVRIEPGYAGFERGMHVFHGLANDGLLGADGGPKGPVNLSVFVCNMDAWLTGFVKWATSPILVAIYKYAQWSGAEEKLLEKYYY